MTAQPAAVTGACPMGAAVTVDELERDPYPVYERLRGAGPVSWIESLGMWYVTSYADVRAILHDAEHFTTASEHSLIVDTFGAHMLTTEDAEHDRYRAALQFAFTPRYIRERLEPCIAATIAGLIDGFRMRGEAELRFEFAARLPILTMLALFGLPSADEFLMRRWYDAFEQALANFTRDTAVRDAARASATEFHHYLDAAIRRVGADDGSLLGALVHAPPAARLGNDELKRNLSIVFFGGISTVEALILNAFWALFTHPDVLARASGDATLLPKVIEETLRWLSPVQSATRHAVRDVTYKGVALRAGTIVNCMLGAANRDPAVFADPDRFDVDRSNAQRHLAFAAGPHSCLGFQLAKLQGRMALEQLLRALPAVRLVDTAAATPRGYEFRQPRAMPIAWDV